MLPSAEIWFALFSAIGYISEMKQIHRLNEKGTKRPWNPILSVSLSSPERPTMSRVLFPGGAHTQSTENTVTETLPSVLRQTLKPSHLGAMSKQAVQKVRKGEAPWHWDIRAAYLFFFLSFVPWVYRNKEKRHKKRSNTVLCKVTFLWESFLLFSVAVWNRPNISMY